MEFVFIFIGLLFGTGVLVLIPYMVYDDWNRAKRYIKSKFTEDDGILGILYVFIGLMFAMVVFITLCAFNNSIWHIDYLTMKGLWQK